MTLNGWFSLFASRTGMLTRVNTNSSSVALTFDDGPDPVATPQVLDLLKLYEARATFFVDGPAARRHPDLIQRMSDEGHEIGLHGWSHTSAEVEAMRGLRPQLRELRRSKHAVRKRVRLYRPPYGHESRWTRIAAALSGVQLVYWNASTEDWRVSPADELGTRITAAAQPGAIVLMHDRLRTAVDPAAFDRSYMISALAMVLSHNSGRVRFGTVTELIATGKPVIRRRRQSHDQLAAMVEQSD